MTKEWVEQKNNEMDAKKDESVTKILAAIEEADFLPKCDALNHIIRLLKNKKLNSFKTHWNWLPFWSDKLSQVREWQKQFDKDILLLGMYSPRYYDYCLDSKEKQFDGDIIITDPCYITKNRTDWKESQYGSKLDMLGIIDFMTRDTIYGDWSCTTYDTDTKQPIGVFCADAGLVTVVSYKQVLTYNPKFADDLKRSPHIATIIKDFHGTVQFVVKEVEYGDDGNVCNDFEVEVIGRGNINFVGTQVGL